MAKQDYSLPYQDLTNLVPSNLRNPMIKSLIDNLFNRFLTKDEAIPLYGYVGRKPSSPDDRAPKVPQSTVERDVNALVPVLSFKTGTEVHSFTVQDLIRKAEVLGISEDQASWLYSQANNYAPPIDFDRFTNFFNYYWVAKALPNAPQLEWNPTLAPEHYTIAPPKASDLDKLNVVAATTAPVVMTGTGFYAQTWIVEFQDESMFTVHATGSGLPSGQEVQTFVLPPMTNGISSTYTVNFIVDGAVEPLVTFKVIRDPIYYADDTIGSESFAAGDKFTITAPFLSSSYTVTPNVGYGIKGKIAAVDSLDKYQIVDGVQLKENDRVLVKNQSTSSENGIYVVRPGAWVRADDFQTVVAGARVFDRNRSMLYVSKDDGSWIATGQTTSNTNDWQESNFWMHQKDVAAAGLDVSKVFQATRPIIEFKANVPLNRFFSGGKPADTGTEYEQRKTEFNQAPLFDLYRYDGTHAGKVSPIFFFAEDPTEKIDTVLQRRVKKAANQSGDFVFAHGLQEDNSLLFYKTAEGSLHTIWHAGYSNAQVVDQEFGGDGNGTLTVEALDPFNAQQIWTLTAVSPVRFEVVGSKTRNLPETVKYIDVGVEYNNGLFKATITDGDEPFKPGDVFTFRIANFETTRYVYRDENEAVYDLFGGAAADTTGVGAWQIPRMFYNNVAADNGDEIPEGTLYSHFRGVLQNQLQTTSEDRAFGGSIKLWSEQQNLLASLLMQRDLTPISMIDFAQRQYETALNSINDIFLKELLQYFSDTEVLATDYDVSEFVDHILSIRAKEHEVRTVMFDSTSPVVGFPATLPMLGVTPLVQPGRVFDNELGVTLFRHHDGHMSPLAVFNQDFRDRLLSPGMMVKRNDGSYTAAIGSFTTTPPARPYKGELWLYPTANGHIVRVFDVLADGFIAPDAEVGQRWYNRNTDELFEWTGFEWISVDKSNAWIVLDPAEILNEVIEVIENRLYAGINAEQRKYFSEADVANALTGALGPQMHRELAEWSVANGYDPVAPDYNASDAFTWNYSSLGLPARWYNVLKAHQASVNAIPTARPNLEPWKLLGFSTKPADWDSQYAADVQPTMIDATYLNGGTARVVRVSHTTALNTPLFGLPTFDGKVLHNGDRILLVSEAVPQNNGVWIVSSGSWSRASLPMIKNLLITVQDGEKYAGTTWVLKADAPTNSNPVIFDQVRLWKYDMWTMIKTARPSLRISVNVANDDLLPPYVSIAMWNAEDAITNTMPNTPAAPYSFGEGSPVETVWTKSIEFRYALARALFRQDPLAFLGFCWGFNWVEVDGILYDSFDMAVPGHPRFRLHGDTVEAQVRSAPIGVELVTGDEPVSLSVTYSAYTTDRKQSFAVRKADGSLVGYAHEGETVTISGAGVTVKGLSIEDEGKPFRLGDTFTIQANADGSGMLVTFEQASYYRFHGFGQTFTQALRASSVDTNQGYAIQAYKGWDVNLGYRAGGLVSTDDLRVFTDSEALPESAYELRFKKSQYAGDYWLQGLRVTTVQIGSATKLSNGGYAPTNDGSDWMFRIEGYNPRNLGLEFYVLDTNGEYQTFNALSKEHTGLEFKQYTDVLQNGTVQLPITITGLQNVVTFLYGYSQKLEADGWRFQDENGGNIDAETGRVRNWQLEIEKLIDRVYGGVQLSEGHVIVPFMDKIWMEHETGLLSQYFDSQLFDVTGHPGVFDALGQKIKTDDLTVLRSRGKSMITAAVPMFSVHAQVDEYEHLFVFSNLSSPSTGEGLIYDPFSGARIVTIKLNGRRQAAETLRPEFGGHYLVGNEVRRNLQSNTDKVAQYYDTDHVFEDELSTRHALALLGFSPKQYMTNLDLTDRSQFNFWRGLVQMKGTNASISAFLNNDRFQDAKVDEYWAYKVAEYGDSRSKIFPELKLTVDDVLQQFTKLQFDAVSALPAFTQIAADDEARWFSIDDLNGETSFAAQVVGTYSKSVVADDIIELPFIADKLTGFAADEVVRINGTTLRALKPLNLTVTGYGPATPKFNPIKLFNYVDNELVVEIPVWHPAAGQHTPAALDSINVISNIDPARYNVSTQVIGNANYDPLRTWGAKEVGRVWWDTTNLDYVPYYDDVIYSDIDGRLSRWGTMADYATMDVVEWVESSVPPVLYNEQALQDAGNADLDPFTKADGEVYGAKTYSRDRVWQVRPIAWSKAGVATEAAHPSFNGSYNSTLNIEDNGLVWLENGTFAGFGITAGMRIGGWIQSDVETRPVSEYLVLNQFTKHIAGAPIGNVTIEASSHTDKVGVLSFSVELISTPILDDQGTMVDTEYSSYLRCTEILSGESELVLVRTERDATFTLTNAMTFTYEFAEFGLVVTLDMAAGTYGIAIPAQTMATALSGIELFDAVRVQAVVPGEETSFSNDSGTVGWRAWNVPTQAQLDADSRVPNSSWKPYVGEFVTITPAIEVVQDAATGSDLTLNDGTVVTRYSTSWADWTELKNTVLRQTAVGTTTTFTIPVVSSDHVSVYVNGVAQLTGTYTIVGSLLSINTVVGAKIVVIVRAYTPTSTELEFDPETADNLLIQRQYKVDYQYVEMPVRGQDGRITETKYYFWVKNRSTAARKKSHSVKAITQLLVTGPSSYLTFQNMNEQFKYDAITISGLSYVVTKDETFKLRFTRNFTLREDPQDLDLKDTHVEWSLIRPGQRTRVPEALWTKMVNSACGVDTAGNVLPSARRISYDERNGTRTQFGFGADQVLAPSELIKSTLLFAILNTKLVDDSGAISVPDYMYFLDFSQADEWFATADSTRNTLTRIWNEGKVSQINELFFAVLEDILASNYELTDIFKTSRLSAYSIKVVRPAPVAPAYE